MAQISYIKYSDVLNANRYDAEYFKPEYIKFDEHIESKNYDFLKKLCKFRNNKRIPIEKTLRNNGVYPYYGAQGIAGYIDKYIFDGDFLLVAEDGENLRSRNQDIAQSVTGKFWVNNHAHILEFQDKKLQNIVEIFLNIAPLRVITGVAQPKLSKENLENIKIPLFPQFFQLQIEEIVKLAHRKHAQSKILHQEAEDLLLEELGLLKYEVKHSLSFTTTKSEISEAHRCDSEYFQPKYAEIIKKIEGYDGGWDFVRNQFKQNTTLSNKAGEFCNYVEISDLNISSGEITPNKIETKSIPANGKRKLFKNDLLVSKVRPYRGAVSFIDFEMDNLIGSGAFTVLQEKTEYKKEVLMIFLKTQFIKELLLRYNCGTSYPVIKDEDILDLKIPLIKATVQERIAEKIQESHRLRKESKELLEEAKRKVEEEIEK